MGLVIQHTLFACVKTQAEQQRLRESMSRSWGAAGASPGSRPGHHMAAISQWWAHPQWAPHSSTIYSSDLQAGHPSSQHPATCAQPFTAAHAPPLLAASGACSMA